MRTEIERLTAVARLKENKKRCREYNFFGGNNHETIDVMIHVIENNLSEADIYDTYPSDTEEEHRKFTAAISARDYLYEEIELSDLLYPEK